MKTLLLLLLLARAPVPSVIPPKPKVIYVESIAHISGESWVRFMINEKGAFYWSSTGRLGQITPPPRSMFRVIP